MPICALEGCNEEFEAAPRKKYHSPRCAKKASNMNRNYGTPKPERTLDDVITHAQERDLARANESELRKILAAESRMQRYEAILSAKLDAYEPMELVTVAAKQKKLPEHEWITLLSDWHVGLKIRMEETGGIYEQDISTARAQVGKIWHAMQRLHALESQGRYVPRIHNLFLGDLVEGDNMRPSQHRKVEEVVTVQTIQGFDLLVWLIRQQLQLVEEVEIDLVGGNHDRTTTKPGDGGLGELDYVDTFAWLAGAFLERVLANDIKSGRLKVRNWSTFFGFKEIAGQQVVFEHGSSFKWSTGGYGGIPWYGVSNLGPQYQSMLGSADLIAIGHGHRPALLPSGRGWIITNGALPATSTYVQAGRKVVSRPQQWLISAHKEMGFTGFHPLYADVPDALLPGMIWDNPSHYADLASGKAA